MHRNPKPLSISDAAAALGVPAWQVRILFKGGTLPEPPRVGPYRVLFASDLPAIRAALEKQGCGPEVASATS
jgi:hypothetical protein